MMQALRNCCLLLIVGIAPSLVIANDGVRKLADWEFHQGDLGGPWEALRTGVKADVLTWARVTVPHCYNAFDAVDPDRPYYQGPAWYRTKVDCRTESPSERLLVRFGAVGQAAQVYVGSQLVAEHTGGYDAFVVDITDAVAACSAKPEAIPLLLRCDNSRDLQRPPSDLSDFTIYGGAYRPIELQIVPSVSIDRVDVTPTVRSEGVSGRVLLQARLRNPTGASGPARITAKLIAPDGSEVVSESLEIDELSDSEPSTIKMLIDRAERWSPSEPKLYSYRVEIDRAGEQHKAVGRFGFRTFRFEKKGPFFLNGERLLLRGTHRHEDHAGHGAATPEAVVREEMRLIKKMGANFIRLGHYQQSELVLNLCDELGLLVWEEIPWCRGGLGGADYQATTRRMLTAMIDQHRNHPSIILWGLGNENDWPGDFEQFDQEEIRGFMQELNELAKESDPSRSTCIRRCEFCKDLVDVYSPSIWAGWYRGRYTDYQAVTHEQVERVDRFFHAEWGASHHAGRHSESPDRGIESVASGEADERDGDFSLSGGDARVSKDGDWSETYACNLIDWHLKEQEEMPWLTGSAYWPFKDFATPLRPENPIPYVNQKGVVQRDLTPKESYYVFQSYWSDTPMIQLYGKTWPVRWGEEGEAKLIKVYSNCPSVELFIDGQSQGVRQRESQDFPAAGLRWRVPLSGGYHSVRAVAHHGEAVLADEMRFRYQTEEWTAPTRLKLEVAEESGDTAIVIATAVDEQGTPCLDAKHRIRFSLVGGGTLLADQGTATGSRVIELANGVASISVMKGDTASTVSATASGLLSQFFEIVARHSRARADSR